jgi:hypothetical protein
MMDFYKIEGIFYEKFITTDHGIIIIHENAYSLQYLLNLVKITEYDLTLLNYEVNIWDQLKD